MVEVGKYEQLIYTIHTIANDLIQTGGDEAQQIANIKTQLDIKWSNLSKKFQSATIFKGRIVLRVFVDEFKFKDMDEEVCYLIAYKVAITQMHQYLLMSYHCFSILCSSLTDVV